MNRKQYKQLRHAYRTLSRQDDDCGWPFSEAKYAHLRIMERFTPRTPWATRKFWLVREQRYGTIQELYNEIKKYAHGLDNISRELKRY